MARACRVCKRVRCEYRPSRRIGTRRKNDAQSARRGWEHRKEKDEAVLVNLDPHEIALWERTKAQFKGTPEQRERSFRQYVHDHPTEIYTQLEVVSDSALARLLKEQRRATDLVEVPCEPPYRVRTKELCAMSRKNPARNTRKRATRKRKPARRKNGLFGESKAQRSRRLSDERARKKLEATSRRTRKGDKTRGDKVKYARRKKNPPPLPSFAPSLPSEARAKAEGLKLQQKLHWNADRLQGARSLPQGAPILYGATLKRPLVVLGELHKIEYVTRKGGDRQDVIYSHTFDKGRTFLLVNGEGELVIAKRHKRDGYKVDGPGIIG